MVEALGSVVFRFSPAWYLTVLAARRLGDRDFGLRHAPLVWRETVSPAPPPGWYRVRMTLAGVCGSDIALLRGELSPRLSPFVSFPAGMGHEGTGVVVEGGSRYQPGERVVIDPFLGCMVRGIPLCSACARGEPALCERTTEGRLAPGIMLGTCRDLPGTWSQEVMAHASQLHRVPAEVSDLRAALVEPFAVALHAVLADRPTATERILVVGGGPIGLLTVAALRLLGHDNAVYLVTRGGRPAELGRRLGADQVFCRPAETAEALAALRHGKLLRALTGEAVLVGGVERSYVAVGSGDGLRLALEATRAGGTVMLLGAPGVERRFDCTPLWAKALCLRGVLAYGREPALAGRHTFELALQLLQDPSLPIEEIVTHQVALRHFREALRLFLRPSTRPLKLLLDCAMAAAPEEPSVVPWETAGRQMLEV